MTNDYLTGIEYDPIRQKIEGMHQAGISWEGLAGLSFLKKYHRSFDDWNQQQLDEVPGWISISSKEWQELVDQMEEEEKQRISIEKRGEGAVLYSDKELSKVAIPTKGKPTWQLYRTHLLQNGFSKASVDTLEKETLEILKHLSNDTTKIGPQKGLVIGNVQSGKTASMAGLMALAADNGWNFFIVLTGLTENLRAQTESRLRKDLKGSRGNLFWQYLGYSAIGDKDFSYEDFSDHDVVFFTVCLKNAKRLKNLIKFLQKDPHPEHLRILIIDDEADQGSVNTGNIQDEDARKSINNLILKLVYGEPSGKGKAKKFGALNYISYTATPYANILNEFKTTDKHKTLYPENFIARISAGGGYFSPSIIFGQPGADPTERLDIVNFVSKEEVREIKEVEKGESMELPDTLKNSILWFICAAAVQRYRNSYSPVSMLIHTSFKVSDQEEIYTNVSGWLHSIKHSAVRLCEPVYRRQTEKFTLADFKQVFSTYEYLDEVKNYPEFDDLKPFIQDLVDEITSIKLDEEDAEKLEYNRGILICVDNSSKNKLDDEGNHLRLVYPKKEEMEELKFATAFIVIGGNTLSRGLTLEGLVSSFFLRHSIQADSLMQMGRWFGYRRGYELLPRIWMTEDTFDKFQNLVDIDEDLRKQISQMAALGKKPTDFQLALITSPKWSWLRLTAKNKMQSAESVQYDFSGSDMQQTVYLKSPAAIEKNNRIIRNFLNHLGQPEISEADGKSGIWRDVPFSEIDDQIFKKGFVVAPTSRVFQDMESLRKWVELETREGNFRKWTVVLAGTEPDDTNPEKNYALNENFRIGKVNRSGSGGDDDKITIKALTNKRDYLAHLRKEDFSSSPDPERAWSSMKTASNISSSYSDYLKLANREDTPILLLYCVDKNSVPKRKSSGSEEGSNKSLKDLGITEDFFGMAMVVPGTRGNHQHKVQIDRRFYDSAEDEENED